MNLKEFEEEWKRAKGILERIHVDLTRIAAANAANFAPPSASFCGAMSEWEKVVRTAQGQDVSTAPLQDTSYTDDLIIALSNLPYPAIQQAVEILRKARREHRRVFIIGNGGSAATALHFACDLEKVAGIAAEALVGNVSTLTAYANDEKYRNSLALQLRVRANAEDVLIAISTSGKSKNIVQAAFEARILAVNTIVLTGRIGCNLRGSADCLINIPLDAPDQVEDVHLAIAHMITRELQHD